LVTRLSMDQMILTDAISGLIKNSLIAWQKPVYQVLCLQPMKQDNRTGSLMSLKNILGGRK
jgi:hypothetical protein